MEAPVYIKFMYSLDVMQHDHYNGGSMSNMIVFRRILCVAGSEGGEFRLSSSLSTPTPAHTVSV